MRQADQDTRHRPCSVMIVSERDAFSRCMSEIFQSDDSRLTNCGESFKAMNGHAAEMAFKNDVVIVEADPDDEEEIHAIEELLAHRTGDTIFLALTNNDVSIAKARHLREIGVDDVLPLSITGHGLRSVIDEKLDALHASPMHASRGASPLGKVIAVSQARGGIGATTLAVNLACSLVGKKNLFGKSEQHRVALLDFDLQFGNLNVFLDIEDNGGFIQTIEAADEPDERFLNAVLQNHKLGVDVLCAPVPIVPVQSIHPDVIENMLKILQLKYDYIVIDLPRALVDWIEPILKRASQLLLVSDTSVPCVRQARRLIDFYREDNVALPIEIVINREKRPFIKTEHLREAEKVLKTKLVHWLPDNIKVAREAVDLGQPIVELRPRSDLGKALIKTATKLSVEAHAEARKSV